MLYAYYDALGGEVTTGTYCGLGNRHGNAIKYGL